MQPQAGDAPGSAVPASAGAPDTAAHFRRLLAGQPAPGEPAQPAAPDAAGLELSALFARVHAYRAQWQSLQQRPSAGNGDLLADVKTEVTVDAMTNASPSGRQMSPATAISLPDDARSRVRSERETGRGTAASDRKSTATGDASNAIAATGLMPVFAATPDLSAPAVASTTGDARPAEDFGELAQLLSRHCEGVYVGAGAAGDGVPRVMLKLGGVMTGVAVEIVGSASGLQVRLHVQDDARWAALAAHKGELERTLSAAGGTVRVEPVLSGGQS